MRSAVGSSFSRRSTDELIFAMTSGALTAATASGVSSNTVISESADALPVTASRANRRASLVSAKSSNGGLMPTRTVASWWSTEVNVLIVSSIRTWTMPTCKSGSSRHADRISRAASLFSIAGKPILPIAGNSPATTTYGPVVGSRSRSAASHRLWLSVIRPTATPRPTPTVLPPAPGSARSAAAGRRWPSPE